MVKDRDHWAGNSTPKKSGTRPRREPGSSSMARQCYTTRPFGRHQAIIFSAYGDVTSFWYNCFEVIITSYATIVTFTEFGRHFKAFKKTHFLCHSLMRISTLGCLCYRRCQRKPLCKVWYLEINRYGILRETIGSHPICIGQSITGLRQIHYFPPLRYSGLTYLI